MDKQIKRYINDWFTVEEIDHDTFAISEYKHWEETHCYLLCGMEKAVLIDTGLGISDIRKVGSRAFNRFADRGDNNPCPLGPHRWTQMHK